MPISPEVVRTRSRLGVVVRTGGDIDDARREHAAAKLADYVKRTVEAAPPLTDEQRSRIAALLHSTSSAGGLNGAA